MAAKYKLIAKELSAEVRSLQQTGLQKLPSEAELCRKYDCSRQTVRSALALLEEKGIIVKRRGSGSYLADNPSAQSRQIAVIVPDRDEYTYPHTIRDIQNTLAPAGYTLRVHSTGGLLAKERAILSSLLEEPPAGIILEAISDLLPCCSADLLGRLAGTDIPIVYLNTSYGIPSGAVCIRPDDRAGGYALAEHLAAMGHRSICTVMLCNDSRGAERYRGCMQAALELGLNLCEHNHLWFSAENRRRLLDGGGDMLRRFIADCLPGCTAVVCYNDEIAFHLIRALTAAGIRVPQEVAVVSFDNSYYALSGALGITSLGLSPHRFGTAAGEAMLALLAGKPCRAAPLPWQMNMRESG